MGFFPVSKEQMPGDIKAMRLVAQRFELVMIAMNRLHGHAEARPHRGHRIECALFACGLLPRLHHGWCISAKVREALFTLL